MNLRPLARGGLALVAVVGLVACGQAVARSHTAAHPAPARIASVTPHVVATGLDQPKALTIAPNGSLVVALSGDGVAPASCPDGAQPSCLDQSGAIDEVSPGGRVTRLVSGLPSVSSGSSAGEASGPAEAVFVAGRLQVLFQDIDISTQSGAEPFGAAGGWLGDLVGFSGAGNSKQRIEARFGPFEAAHDPDHGVGTAVTYHGESAVDSDPYSFVPYRGGYAVADAGGNDVLFVSRTGRISVLAVFPTIREAAPAGTFGPEQTRAIQARAQVVPDTIVVGPDGALYVGALGGTPYGAGRSSVYRVVPGHPATVYARGFTSISAIAFDRSGRLLVLEIERNGLGDPALKGSGPPPPGQLIRVPRRGRRTILASAGLEFPSGMTVARNGAIYVAIYGISSAGPGFHGGEIVRVGRG